AAHEGLTRPSRASAGSFQLFVRERWLFNPLANRLWLQTISHKALRLMIPALQAVLLVSNIWLAQVGPYGLILAAHLAFYAAALFGCARRRAGRRPIFVSVPH